jgi:hypothetical protein
MREDRLVDGRIWNNVWTNVCGETDFNIMIMVWNSVGIRVMPDAIRDAIRFNAKDHVGAMSFTYMQLGAAYQTLEQL